MARYSRIIKQNIVHKMMKCFLKGQGVGLDLIIECSWKARTEIFEKT